jgi:hypothetical protein
VLGDGAGRGKTITSVVSMHPFKGRLCVGALLEPGAIAGSELIRINPNNQWSSSLVTPDRSEPKSSPHQRDPDSFGNIFTSHFWRMQEDHGC